MARERLATHGTTPAPLILHRGRRLPPASLQGGTAFFPQGGIGRPTPQPQRTPASLLCARRLAITGRPGPGAVGSSFNAPTGVPPSPPCAVLLFLASTCGCNKSVLGCRALGGQGEHEWCDWLSGYRLPLRAHIS